MDGYSNLASSPPAASASGHGARAARPSMELTNTKETKAWEGLAIGAVTLARTFSTGSSHRFRRSGSERRGRSRSGLPGALRRAFSMRRYHPAGPGCGAGDGYWRIHDMDGGMSDRGDDTVVEEHGEDDAAREEAESKKQAEQRDEDGAAAADTAAGKEDAEGRTTTAKKKKRGGILKACKKLFRL
ncbi:uncharacterized protein C2845_PM05G37290 [Panicum miliaceum]|uniref:Uncharacterized protein n=1 Tax=Panicum miliaceum TaxID=4540 RepID=A0A3L6T0R0_PANMI|nr:uncharacterized protein C2845_PM05G37290 [Panicum miliaceum]